MLMMGKWRNIDFRIGIVICYGANKQGSKKKFLVDTRSVNLGIHWTGIESNGP